MTVMDETVPQHMRALQAANEKRALLYAASNALRYHLAEPDDVLRRPEVANQRVYEFLQNLPATRTVLEAPPHRHGKQFSRRNEKSARRLCIDCQLNPWTKLGKLTDRQMALVCRWVSDHYVRLSTPQSLLPAIGGGCTLPDRDPGEYAGRTWQTRRGKGGAVFEVFADHGDHVHVRNVDGSGVFRSMLKTTLHGSRDYREVIDQ